MQSRLTHNYIGTVQGHTLRKDRTQSQETRGDASPGLVWLPKCGRDCEPISLTPPICCRTHADERCFVHTRRREVSSMNRSHRHTSQTIRRMAVVVMLALLPATGQAGMPSWALSGRAGQDHDFQREIGDSSAITRAPRVILVSRKAVPPPPPSSTSPPPPSSTPPPPSTAVSAVVAWDPNTEADLMGYKLYVGSSSGVYGSAIDVGNFTDYEVRNLEPGRTFYFSVTAYDLSGNESAHSDEISNVLSTSAISCTRDAAGALVCSNG